MDPMPASVMIDQLASLPGMVREIAEEFNWGEKSARRAISTLEYLSVNRVYTAGNGDSYHAALATELAFEELGGIACEPYNAMRMLEYGIQEIPAPFPNDPFIVGISASGTTAQVVAFMEKAKEKGHFTIGLVGNPDSKLGQIADRVISTAAPIIGRSPGIRTYVANLLGLYMMAIRIGELKDRYHMDVANGLRAEVFKLADVIEATAAACQESVRAAVEVIKGSAATVWLGTGPSYGTAMFSAAKVVEAAGVFSVGQDLEEWAHVERFARPNDMPTFIIAPPGRSYWRAVQVAEAAKAVGRRVVAIVKDGDSEVAAHADLVLPIAGEVREEFSPIVYHIPACYLASYLTDALGRMCFQTDNAEFWTARQG